MGSLAVVEERHATLTDGAVARETFQMKQRKIHLEAADGAPACTLRRSESGWQTTPTLRDVTCQRCRKRGLDSLVSELVRNSGGSDAGQK